MRDATRPLYPADVPSAASDDDILRRLELLVRAVRAAAVATLRWSVANSRESLVVLD